MSALTQAYSVIVPENTYPGDNIVIEVEGEEYEILVPQGCSPGTELQVELPVARQSHEQRRRKSSRDSTNHRRGRSDSWKLSNHPTRNAPPPKDPLWLDVSLVAGDQLAVGEWASVDIYEARGGDWKKCTSKALWERITHPASTIRISPVPETSRFLVKVSGDGLESSSLEVSPNTHVKMPVRSHASRRQEKEQAAVIEQERQAVQQRILAEQQQHVQQQRLLLD